MFKKFPIPRYLKSRINTKLNAIVLPRLVSPNNIEKVNVRVRVSIKKNKITNKKLLGDKKYTMPDNTNQSSSVNIKLGRKFLRLFGV